MACAKRGPFTSCAACMPSLSNAAVASLTRVTWYPSSMPKRAVDSMQVFATKPTRMIFSIPRCLVAFSPAVMRHDDDLDTRSSDRGNQLAHVVVKADRLGRLFGSLVELATFAHEIVVRIDDQQRGSV